MRGFFLAFSLIFLLACEAAPSLNPGAFEKNLLESIALNESRMERYAALTQNESRPIMETLIHQQKVAVGIAQGLDKRADLKNFFNSSNEIPSFQEAGNYYPFDASLFLKSENSPDAFKIQNELRSIYKTSGFAALSMVVDAELLKLESQPEVFCMFRHFLETIRHASRMATKQNAAVAWDFIDLHISYLSEALALDKKALPIQARGIPILCQDLPKGSL